MVERFGNKANLLVTMVASILTLLLFHLQPAHHGLPWLLVVPGASDHSAALPPEPQ